MKQRLRMQYYCGFCKKSGAVKSCIANHEKYCTNNPDRECRMCVLGMGGHSHSVKELIEIIGEGGEGSLERLREATDGCPACMLAGIRQSKINDYTSDDTFESYRKREVGFEYKKERDEFMEEVNSNIEQPDYYDYERD